jgi:uncharacterized protein (TIGR02246 family)
MSLERRLQKLEDREAIRDLVARYGPLADRGDAAGVAALWVENGRYVIAGFGTATGHAEITALITGATHQKLMADGCAHILGPVAVELLGDSAIAIGHSIVLRWTGTQFEAARVAANRWELIRTAKGWRVSLRENALLTGIEAARALLSLPA